MFLFQPVILCIHLCMTAVLILIDEHFKYNFVWMGPKQSTPVLGSEPKESFLISHPRFSKAKLLSDNSGEYMQISLPIANEA